MALIVADRVQESTTTTGTGALTLAGAHTGYRAFSAVMTSPSDTCYYGIFAVDSNGNPSGAWEVGLGTYSASNTLTRTTPAASSNAGAAVNFGAGTKYVYIDATAGYLGLAYRSGGTDVALADGGTGASLSDPNADRIMFWDDSAGAVDWLTPGTGLSISGTTLNGSSSTSYEGGPAGTLPTVSGMTSINLGTSTFTQSAHSIIFLPQTGAGFRGYYQAAPGATFDVYMRMQIFSYSVGNAPQCWAGILLRNSGGSNNGYVHGLDSASVSFPRFETARVNSTAGITATPITLYTGARYVPVWLRANVGAATITLYVGFNGFDWTQIGTETIATHVAAVNQWGFVCLVSDTGGVAIDYLSTTAPA